MILTLLALAAVQSAAPAPAPAVSAADEQAYRACTDAIRIAPDKAVQTATDWQARGGGILARQCLGLAYVQLERWPAAAAAFESAALEAEKGQDPRRSDFWVQAGNSWIGAANGANARKAFDAALATNALSPELRGEVHLDRARAGVMLDDLAGARRDIDRGMELVPADPFAWYLSAALAQRQGDLKRAQSDVAKALKMAPHDANILLLAGNIAGLSGEVDAARTFYTRAADAAPDSPAGKSAQAALAANPPSEPAPPAPAPSPAAPKKS